MSPVLLVIIALLVLYKFYNFATYKPGKAPPGPIRLPLVGSYWFLLWGNYKFPHETIWYYVEKYKSKVISLYLGSAYTVIVNDYSTVKEVLSRKEFDGRDTSSFLGLTRSWGKPLGLFFNDGEEWQEQRRFALRNMRDFGFGRRHKQLEANFNEELQILVETIKNGPINKSEKKIVNGDLVYFPHVLFPACANIIWSVMSGKRLDRPNHDELRQLCVYASMFQKGGDGTGGALSIANWLRHFGNLFGYKDWVNGHQGLVKFVKKYMDERSEAAMADKAIDGFISVYLKELRESKYNSKSFSEQQLLMVTIDFMFPPLSTVPSVVVHCIKYMLHYPDVMRRVQEELDSVVGNERLPEWNDTKNLPYTGATIREVMRMETATPLGVAHQCRESTTLQGYDIPAKATVITNLAGMHRDPDLWGDPQNFRPERFLDENGQLGKNMTFPFGFGRRVCSGETFARFVVYELFATLVHQFDFSSVKGQPSGLDDKYPGMIVQPTGAWIRLSARK